jgi:hypothetical protein
MTDEFRQDHEVEALRTDRYLEALLAAAEEHKTDVPSDADLDPAVRDAARTLARELIRFHPSFRFEERLAARLGRAAQEMQLASAAGGESLPVPLRPLAIDAGEAGDFDPLADPLADDTAPGAGDDARQIRPILIGGALTSAALSLAGAAWVAWRRSQATVRGGSPMARAVRAAHQARRAGVRTRSR